MFYIQQSEKHDCAFTCLEIMLANFHHDKNYLFFKHEDREYSFKELIAFSENYNLDLIGIKVENADEVLKCQKFPLIIILKTPEDTYHSVLLLKINPKRATIYDPQLGKKSIPFEVFEERWTKRALMIKEGHKMKRPDNPPDFIATRDKIFLPILQIVSGFSLLIGTYFIDKNAYILIPIIFFALFIIFELLFRDGLIRAMKRMDEEINSRPLEEKNLKYDSLYEDSEKYRLKALSFYPNVIYSFMITLFLSVILILNGTINDVYIAASLLIAIIEAVILDPYFKSKAQEIASDENEIPKCESEEEYKELVTDIRSKAYNLGLYKTAITYLGVGALLMISIVLMALSQIVSVTYVVFYLCIAVFLRNNFNKMLTYTNDQAEKDLYRAKIINYLKEEEYYS